MLYCTSCGNKKRSNVGELCIRCLRRKAAKPEVLLKREIDAGYGRERFDGKYKRLSR